ncbi:hypothetical protein Cgig2_025801 [Carnegiea gigantea]|uniref:Uncharacterized protein n=1 Tax=Carnegiea gigantea TaxID=171969 RepID=A0A9Q1KDR9_9CARY|nr:hypothetical protein Cgig2_025801 [Carnegiea gigantea]
MVRREKVQGRWNQERDGKECWGLSLGSHYLLEDVTGDNVGDVALAEEGDFDLYSAKEMESNRTQCDERKRVPVEAKGRYRGRMTRGDGDVIGDDKGVGVIVGSDPVLRRRVTLDIVVDFVSRLGLVHVEAIKGSEGIQNRGRLIPFTVFDVAFMTDLLAIKRRVEFDGEEVSGDLGRMVKERIAEIVAAKRGKWKCQKEGRRSTLWNYIRVMSDLCDENNEEDSIPWTPCGAAWSLERYVDDVQHF